MQLDTCINVINLDTWKKLPPDLQKLIGDTFREGESDVIKYLADVEMKYKDMAKNAGIEVTTLDKAEFARWQQTAGLPVWESTANRIGGTDGPLFLKIMKDWHGIK